MEQLRYTSEDRSFRRLMGCMAALLLLFYMVCPAAPVRWNDLYNSYGKILIIAMAAIYFYKCRFKGCIEVRIVIIYAIWVFITRLLNTDLYLQNELDLVISRILCCVIFPVGMLLEPDERSKLLDFIIAVSCAFFLATGLMAVYACVFGVYFYVPPENVVFGIDNNYMFNTYTYIVPWGTNRTIAAVWFYYGWCMMAYEFFHCKNKLWRIPICVAWFCFHLIMAFSFCRSLMLAISVNVGMLLILLGIKYIKVKKIAVKAVIIVLITALSLPVTFQSFEVLRSASASVYNSLDTDIERIADEYMANSFVEKTQDNGQSFEDPRDMKKSVSNISNRGEIYASVIPTIKLDPMRLLIGKYSDKIMDIPNLFQSFPYYHMHNMFLHVLMLTGVIGLLLVLAFTVLMVIKMIRVFFSNHPLAGMDIKVLTLPISGIFIYSLLELILFTASSDDRSVTDFRELFFFLIAGIFLSYYYQIFPPKAKK
ncbi:MAG: O-antigen ligase family protein [Oscillospiraceae bacterium]|nr:O-antigen ligase family protein [Oscillospiraceae bacterium]